MAVAINIAGVFSSTSAAPSVTSFLVFLQTRMPAPRQTSDMPLIFPNRSRTFDEDRQGVLFTAYDGMFEVPILVEMAALQTDTTPITQEDCLAAFDAARTRIHQAAIRIYRGRQNAIYRIGLADLR